MTLSYDYWKEREEKAREQTIRDEKRHEEEIEEIYKRMFDEIQRDIDEFFAKYAADEGITIAEAKKRVSKLDMEEFERKAKEYVKNKDFSDQANEEMKLYNLTMKVNRLEMLKAKIGLELVNGYQEIEDYMGEALTETTMKEIERHAGILGKTVGDNQDYAEDIVDASFHNATWSERIWANQDRLKHDLGKLLTSGLIQGKNPRELARDLQKSMNVSKYDAERLMRTEMCRVQIDASLREIEANGFTEFIFIADSGGSRTCEQCKALDGKTFALKDGKVGVNLPPLHPNCRCSIAGHEDDDDFINWLENHGVEVTDEDLQAMGLSRKEDSSLPDRIVPRSIGARYTNYDILDFETGMTYHLIEGTRIKNITVFAGKGSKTPFRKAYVYAERYGNDISDWSHVKGIAEIENEYESGTAEIHWVESEETGMVDPFVKKWL